MAATFIAKVLITILKTALFLLLAVILIILLILCLVLFTSLKYNIYAEKYDAIKAEGKVSWLFGIVAFSFCCNSNGNSYKLKIFGADYKKLAGFLAKFFKKKEKEVYSLETSEKPFNDKNKNRGENYEKKKENKTFPHEKENLTINKDKTPVKEDKEDAGKDKTPQKDAEMEIRDKKAEKTLQHDKDSGTDKNKRASSNTIFVTFCKKITGIPEKIKNIFTKTRRTIKEFKEKLQEIPETVHKVTDKASRIKEFIFSEITKNMFVLAKDKLFYLLKKIKPRKIEGDILIGTGDPCQTGLVLGAAAAYMALAGTFFNITPDFENKVFCGRLMVSGHIRAVTLLAIFLRVIISREWKSFYKESMKIKEEF